MKKTGFLTAVTIIIALELTNFGYAPDIPKYENRVHKYNKTPVDESHTKYDGHRTYHAEEWRSLGNPVEHRLFLKDEKGAYVSTWNDIPLLTGRDRVFRVVTVVPRRTTPIMAISRCQKLNPIIQFSHGPVARSLPESFSQTYGYSWNLGSFPQTWQDMDKLDALTGIAGNDGLVDVLEIGGRTAKRGHVTEVKVLAAYPMIDEWLTDWKVIAIDADHPNAGALNDVHDVRQHYPGLLDEVERWLTTYREEIGLSQYEFWSGLDPVAPVNAADAAHAVRRKHDNWKELQRRTETTGTSSHLSRVNTTLANALSATRDKVDFFMPRENKRWAGPGSILSDDENAERRSQGTV